MNRDPATFGRHFATVTWLQIWALLACLSGLSNGIPQARVTDKIYPTAPWRDYQSHRLRLGVVVAAPQHLLSPVVHSAPSQAEEDGTPFPDMKRVCLSEKRESKDYLVPSSSS